MSSCPPPESLAGSPNSGRTLGSPARGSVTVGRWLHVPVPRPKGDSASGLHGHYVLAGLWGRAVALVVDTQGVWGSRGLCRLPTMAQEAQTCSHRCGGAAFIEPYPTPSPTSFPWDP